MPQGAAHACALHTALDCAGLCFCPHLPCLPSFATPPSATIIRVMPCHAATCPLHTSCQRGTVVSKRFELEQQCYDPYTHTHNRAPGNAQGAICSWKGCRLVRETAGHATGPLERRPDGVKSYGGVRCLVLQVGEGDGGGGRGGGQLCGAVCVWMDDGIGVGMVEGADRGGEDEW